MKRGTLKSIVLALFAVLSYMQSLKAQSTPYEDRLIFEHTYLSNTIYQTGGNLFRNIFQVQEPVGNQYQFAPDATFEQTTYSAFAQLKSTLPISNTGSSYAAFRIIYGLEQFSVNDSLRYRIVFIYVPLIMKIKGSGQDIDTFESDALVNSSIESSRFYRLNKQKQFEKLNPDTARKFVSNYKMFIRIDERNNNSFRGHNSNGNLSDRMNDATSETFAFKEIEYFFDTCSNVYISSYANIGLMYGVPTFKHFIAFSNDKYYEVNLGSTIAADLGTMCPPNCMGQVIHAGRTQALVAKYAHLLGGREPKTDSPDRKIIWILVIIGSVLTGFIASRLLKK